MRNIGRFWAALFKSPLVWGALGSVGFYGLLDAGLLGRQFLQRYCGGHPVEYVETSLFFVGLAALAIRALEVAGQRKHLGEAVLGPIPRGGQTPADCPALEDRLAALPASRQNDCLVRRLRDGLSYVARRDSSRLLDEHLRHLADADADRAQSGYGLVRLIVWAIPILGFLGTVIGITMAVANLKISALEESMVNMLPGLAVAFDTTALALALSMVLMFVQFYVDRAEGRLLDEVSRQAEAELAGRFCEAPATPDGQLAAMRRMSDTLVAALDQLVRRQTELWGASMQSAQERWAGLADSAGKQLQASLAGALAQTARTHAQQMAAAEEAAAERSRRHWAEVQQSLARVAEALAATQQALVHKAEVLGRAVEGTAYVARLEETLNRNPVSYTHLTLPTNREV